MKAFVVNLSSPFPHSNHTASLSGTSAFFLHGREICYELQYQVQPMERCGAISKKNQTFFLILYNPFSFKILYIFNIRLFVELLCRHLKENKLSEIDSKKKIFCMRGQ